MGGAWGHVFDNWPECQSFVAVHKGCKYKSFVDREHAVQFSEGEEIVTKSHADCPTALEIWTDGATSNNGSVDKASIRAGIGVYFGKWGHPWNVSEPFMLENPTNQRAEILAIVRAMEVLDAYSVPIDTEVVLYTDSRYCVKAYTAWIPQWRLAKRNWTTKNGTPVKNKELFEKMYSLCSRRKIKMVHVAGHSGNPGNEAADRLAVRGCM